LLFAKGGTASLTFRKIAVSSKETQTYIVKKGDRVVSIIRKQLKEKGRDVFKTLELVRRLNPHTRNLDRIHPGQALKLPVLVAPAADQEIKVSEIKSSAVKESSSVEKHLMPPGNRLAVITHIVKRMNGTVVTTGSHFIPLSPRGQATIDCSRIPLVELDDGSVILLDFGNRIPENLGKMIRESWKNYHLVKAASDEDTVRILRKIINASKLYRLERISKPLIMGGPLQVRLLFDWIITKDKVQGSQYYLQGLSFVTENSLLLPEPLIKYADKKGMLITEILDGNPVTDKADSAYTIPAMPGINKTAANSELVRLLLTNLGFLPAKDADIEVFDMQKDGFNLSFMADLVVKKGDRRVIIHTKKLPQQFIDILRSEGTEVAFIGEEETKRAAVEKALHAVDIPFSSQTFSFSIPGEALHRKARAAVSFSAVKTTTADKGDLYLVDFEMDREIYGLLHYKRGVNILGY
jgi:hypothetical protein